MEGNPKKIDKEQLVLALRDMAARIEADDSFEGRIVYTCIGDHFDDLGPGEFEVDAFWRIGNSMGQGGCHIIASDA